MSGGPVPIHKKYTVGSKGIWERIRRLLVLVPNRSTGNPIVSWYRQPTPGSRPEVASYSDPATLPTSDIAENPYWKRDHRRTYPRTAHFNQSTVAGLLLYGSSATPRIADGDAGTQALSLVTGGKASLNEALVNTGPSVLKGEVLDKSGLPPLPPSFRPYSYSVVPFSESGMYKDDSTVRSFK